MSTTPPTDIPSTLAAGDRWRWTRTLSNYPASAWTCTYYLRGIGTADVEGTADGDVHDFVVEAVTTAALAAGVYRWILRADDGAGDIRTIDSGTTEITADLAEADAGDLRSHAEVMVEKLEDEIQARVSGTGDAAERVVFHSREFEAVPLRELQRLLGIYKAQLIRQRNGGKLPAIHAAFTRVT